MIVFVLECKVTHKSLLDQSDIQLRGVRCDLKKFAVTLVIDVASRHLLGVVRFFNIDQEGSLVHHGFAFLFAGLTDRRDPRDFANIGSGVLFIVQQCRLGLFRQFVLGQSVSYEVAAVNDPHILHLRGLWLWPKGNHCLHGPVENALVLR